MSGKISLLLITPSIASTTFMVLVTFWEMLLLMPYFLWRIVCKVSKVNGDESVKHSNFQLALNLLSNKDNVENF